MTDREKAIVMAFTGTTMLTGDKLQIFYDYVAEFTADKVAQRLQILASATGGVTAEEAIAKLIALAKAGCT